MKSKYIKYILSGILAIIIGALGSGVWEIALKPVSFSVVDGIINGGSYLIKSLKDSLYLSTAKGYQEESANFAVQLILAIMWGLSGVLIGISFNNKRFGLRSFSRELGEIGKEIDKIHSREDVDSKKIDELKNKLDIIKLRLRKRLKIVVFFIILIISFLSVQWIIITFKNTAISSYNQSLLVIKPYITTNEYDIFNSRFAQIKNEENYYKIISDLNLIAKKNNLILPSKK